MDLRYVQAIPGILDPGFSRSSNGIVPDTLFSAKARAARCVEDAHSHVPAYNLLLTPSLEWQRQCFGAIFFSLFLINNFSRRSSFSTRAYFDGVYRYLSFLSLFIFHFKNICAVMTALPHQTDI